LRAICNARDRNKNCQPFLKAMIKVSWPARVREGALSFVALVALLSILYVIDFRVRDEAARAVEVTSPSHVAQSTAQFSANASELVANLKDQGMQHASILVFVGTAGVLLLFMLKA